MNILLTGGLGYMGSHLCRRLSEDDKIIILDNFSNNLKNIKKQKNVKIIYEDIRNRMVVDRITKGIDIIIHTAAQISITRSIEDPIYDADNNIVGTLNLLEAARKYMTKRFIYISSAAVYGAPIYLPVDEKHVTNPISPYGLSKLTGERYSLLYHDLYGLPVTCIRPFNIFGPGQMKNSYSGVITKFVDNVKSDNCPIIFGDGSQTRDFVYINDVVDAILLIMKNDDAIGQVFNIGSGNPTNIKDLANIIIEISDKDLSIKFEDPKVGDIKESYSDITKAKKLLGYEPRQPLKDGLALFF